MANSGLLGKGTTTQAGAHTTFYTVPSSGVSFAVLSVDLLNPTDTEMTATLAVTTNTTPVEASGDYLETKIVLPPHGIYMRTCSCVSPNERIIVSSSAPGLSCRVSGVEEAS